jgi:Mrp family chromosome partitioning ATPase
LTVLQSPEIAQLIGSVSSWFDWVIIDSPPLVPLADARTWGTIVDCILVVSRRALTPRKLLQQNLATVEKSKILGVVLNDADSDAHRYYAHYYKQSAGNGKTEPTPRPKFEGTSA